MLYCRMLFAVANEPPFITYAVDIVDLLSLLRVVKVTRLLRSAKHIYIVIPTTP